MEKIEEILLNDFNMATRYTNICDLQQDNIYFKMHCMYNAKTELFDRTLTDMRSRFDKTEAFIDVSRRVRKLSNYNAKKVYNFCVKTIEKITNKSFDSHLWRESVREYYSMSAQGWIDLYESLVKNGELEE